MAAPLSPLAIPELYCFDCGQKMRTVIERHRSGKINKATAYCDPCKYGFELSLIHAQGTQVGYKPTGINQD